ncbi:MAG: thioesterase family protein [Acidimicrobiales bacterium]|nr:thioesterase family protein [Acidimicrobiales bacterium]
MDSDWHVSDLVAQMDVTPDDDGNWNGLVKFSEDRPVVEGSQLLGQAIAAAMRTTGGRRVVSAHMAFTRVVNATIPAPIMLREITNGRTMSSYWVEVAQGGKVGAAGTMLLDATAPDVMRHSPDMPKVTGPTDSPELEFGVAGREVRIVDAAYTNDANAPVGTPVIDAWVRLGDVPDDAAIHAGLLAQFTGHMSIAAAMRPHAGIGQEQAHRTLSTGVNAIHLSLHADVRVDEWLLYHQHATFAGDGMTHSDCQVFTEAGALVASFSVESMVRGFADPSKAGDARTAM